jgi:hypothetical protein
LKIAFILLFILAMARNEYFSEPILIYLALFEVRDEKPWPDEPAVGAPRVPRRILG